MEARWDKNQGISSNYFLMIFYVSGPIWDIWRGDSPGLWLPSLVRSSCVRRRRRSWWKEKAKNEPKTEMKAKSPPWAYCAQGRRRKEKPVEEGKYDNGFNGLVIEKTRILWQGWLEKGTKNVQKVMMLLYSWDMSNNFCRSIFFMVLVVLHINIVLKQLYIKIKYI